MAILRKYKICRLPLIMTAMLLLFACGFTPYHTPKELPEGLEIPEYDSGEDIIVHTGYTASYNHATLCPDWVAWELTAEEVNGTQEGKVSFSRDPDVADPKASREDYSKSGWDKGHMAPRADMKWSATALKESYFFTNICPQEHTMNSSAWRKIEELARHVALRRGSVYVVCGPIFNEHRHGSIGAGGVQVPDAFFKALAISVNGNFQTVAFLMDNEPQTYSPRHYAVSVDSVESVIGRNLFPQLDEEVERGYDWNVWK